MKKVKAINLTLKSNIVSILSFLIVLQPIIDMTIGLSIKTNFFPSIMSLIRMIILIFLLYYFVFVNTSKIKKKIILMLMIIFTYLLCFFINVDFSFVELKSAIKVFYFPLIFLITVSIFNEEKKFIDKKYFLISLGLYALIIIVGYLTNTAFNSYFESKVGTSGYFHSANEIGAIISILLPFAFGYVFNKVSLKKFLYLFIIISAILLLGTKTPFISLFICLIYYIGKLLMKRNVLKVCLISFVSVIIIVFIITKLPIYQNMIIHASFLEIESIVEFIEQPDLIDHFLLGSRLKFLDQNHQIYIKSDMNDKLFGIGYFKNPKIVEMDFFDIFYRQGVVGFIIHIFSIFSIFLFNKKKNSKDYILPIILTILIASLVGHVIVAPAVSTFVALILCGNMKEKEI